MLKEYEHLPHKLRTLKAMIKQERIALKKRQRFFLDYTARFYHLGNRAVVESGLCCYTPIKGQSPGCAIGQHLPPEVFEHEKFREGLAAESLIRECKSTIPSWMKSLSTTRRIMDPGEFEEELKRIRISHIATNFLEAVQNLHDSYGLWANDGITEKGKLYCALVLELFELNQPTS